MSRNLREDQEDLAYQAALFDQLSLMVPQILDFQGYQVLLSNNIMLH